MNARISMLILGIFLIVGCGDEPSPTSTTPNPTGGISATPSGPLGLAAGARQSTTPQLTTVGQILENPNSSQELEVALQGRATDQLESGKFLFTDGTGEIPLVFDPLGPLPALGVAIRVEGTVAGGSGGYAATINVRSWEVLPPFSCDDMLEARARFSDPGFAFGNVVGLFLSYRGAPPGDKILEMSWDVHNPSGSVEQIPLGPGVQREDGLFYLEGVVTHEYPDVRRTESKQVRANLKIEGRDGSCSRVRDVTVTPGSGPGFGGGGTISVSVDQGDTIRSGSKFSVRAKVDNKTSVTADVAILFDTPDPAELVTASGSRCTVLNEELVECIIEGVKPGEKFTRVVEYRAPAVSRPTEIAGSVTLVAENWAPVATYRVTVQP